MQRLVVFFLPFVLLACASEPGVQPIVLDFSSLAKVHLDARDIQIVDRGRKMPQTAPYIGHLFEPTVAQAVSRMAGEKLQTADGNGRIVFVIKDASVTEQTIDPPNEGLIKDFFTRHQALKYIGRVEVALEATSADGATTAVATASAVHNVTLPEKPTAIEKQEAYRTLLKGLLGTLNKNLDDTTIRHLGAFMRSTPKTETKT